jgi:hypothetical protein
MDWYSVIQIIITIIGWEAVKKIWQTLTIGTLYKSSPNGIEMVKFPRKDLDLQIELKKQGFVEWKEL